MPVPPPDPPERPPETAPEKPPPLVPIKEPKAPESQPGSKSTTKQGKKPWFTEEGLVDFSKLENQVVVELPNVRKPLVHLLINEENEGR